MKPTMQPFCAIPLRNMFINSQLPIVYLAFWASISKSLIYWSMLGKWKVRQSRLAWVTSCLVESTNYVSNHVKKLRYMYSMLSFIG